MAAPSRQPAPRDISARSAIPRPAPRPSALRFSAAPTPAPLRALDTPLWKVRPQFDGFDLAETSDWIEEATPTAHDGAAPETAGDITHLSPRDAADVLRESETVFTGRGERESTYGSSTYASSSATAGPSKRPASPSAPVNVAKRRMPILETPKSDDLYARKLAGSVRRSTPKVFTPVAPSPVTSVPRSSESRTSRTPVQPVPPPEPLESRQLPPTQTGSKTPKVPEIARPRPGTRITIGIGSGGKIKTRAERAASNGKFVTPASRSRQSQQQPANATAGPSRVTTRPPRSAKRTAQMLPPPPPPAHSADTSSSSMSSNKSHPQQLARVPRDASLVNLEIPAIRRSTMADGPSRPQSPAAAESSTTTPARAPPVPVDPTPVPSRATPLAIPASLPRRFFPFTFSFPSPSVATPRAANQTLQYASPALSSTTAEGQPEDWDVSTTSVARSAVETVMATPQTQVAVPSAAATPVAQMTVEPARRISASERVLRFIGGLLGAGSEEAASPAQPEEPMDVVEPEAESPADDDVEMVQVRHEPVTIMVAPPPSRSAVLPTKPARMASGNFARPTSSTAARAAPSKPPPSHAPSHPERPVVRLRRPLGALRTQPIAPNLPTTTTAAAANANAEKKKPLCPPTNSRFASAALARLPKPGEGHTSNAAPTRIRDAERARDLAIKRAVFERAGKADAALPMPATLGGARRLAPSASAAPLYLHRGHTPGKASRLRAEQRAVFDSGVAERAAARAAEDAELARIRAEVEAEMDREARRAAMFRANPLPEMYGRPVQ